MDSTVLLSSDDMCVCACVPAGIRDEKSVRRAFIENGDSCRIHKYRTTKEKSLGDSAVIGITSVIFVDREQSMLYYARYATRHGKGSQPFLGE